MPEGTSSGLDTDHALILDRIYEIALDPSFLEDFIQLWADADLAEQFAPGKDGAASAFDAYFNAHLERAEAFLRRGDTSPPDAQDHLKPYASFAAFTVNTSLVVEDVNAGAKAAFDVQAGDTLASLDIPQDVQASLLRLTRDVLHRPDCLERLLKAEAQTKQGTMLFRIVRVTQTADREPVALLVSTYIHWRESVGTILKQAFQLTQAEQGVVRRLTEGQDTKSIANARGTTVGTVREQLKSIISKMNVRSQADVVRLALTLGEFPQAQAAETRPSQAPETAFAAKGRWLQSEVWKPFKSVTLPDGRHMTYHDMGPQSGNPILFSHMGSAMVRWTPAMVHSAFEHNLRVICPIRAGYGHSDNLRTDADVLSTTSADAVFLLQHLGLSRLPYAIHGSDFPFAADLVARHPEVVSELIGIGARPCLPNGLDVQGAGQWQRFFVWAARHNPGLARFAAKAVMMMAKRIGPEAMLRKLCQDSPADLMLLETDEVRQILVANLELMAGPSTNAAQAFAMEYVAFHADWSHLMQRMRHIPVRVYIAEQDPTIDINAISALRTAYPWMHFEIVPNAGLALMYQQHDKLIPILAEAARGTRTMKLASKPDLKLAVDAG
ncbi:Transcriptional regulator, LuxR family/hydrolase, alpha/beta fold family [Candidatus Rhodobacter oscarellae]|uniref:Transcriptional regulator, LuxR family/hydrolase, alpha/beta fold family n=1 Tax=Candidatus Rhodobacter oscarellae TaxID=1675527 RepID=A0A0J9EAR6_9RHOB|nr:LuxR C-terminal-related transcriptional regulator [Candidatus Rhodobacter lobularis]KMW59880.1 Transcriptional regulator, LuxR family/hydrolase, alpha/beta fold family [Candidatus Rhodobacter lobularis]